MKRYLQKHRPSTDTDRKYAPSERSNYLIFVCVCVCVCVSISLIITPVFAFERLVVTRGKKRMPPKKAYGRSRALPSKNKRPKAGKTSDDTENSGLARWGNSIMSFFSRSADGSPLESGKTTKKDRRDRDKKDPSNDSNDDCVLIEATPNNGNTMSQLSELSAIDSSDDEKKTSSEEMRSAKLIQSTSSTKLPRKDEFSLPSVPPMVKLSEAATFSSIKSKKTTELQQAQGQQGQSVGQRRQSQRQKKSRQYLPLGLTLRPLVYSNGENGEGGEIRTGPSSHNIGEDSIGKTMGRCPTSGPPPESAIDLPIFPKIKLTDGISRKQLVVVAVGGGWVEVRLGEGVRNASKVIRGWCWRGEGKDEKNGGVVSIRVSRLCVKPGPGVDTKTPETEEELKKRTVRIHPGDVLLFNGYLKWPGLAKVKNGIEEDAKGVCFMAVGRDVEEVVVDDSPSTSVTSTKYSESQMNSLSEMESLSTDFRIGDLIVVNPEENSQRLLLNNSACDNLASNGANWVDENIKIAANELEQSKVDSSSSEALLNFPLFGLVTSISGDSNSVEVTFDSTYSAGKNGKNVRSFPCPNNILRKIIEGKEEITGRVWFEQLKPVSFVNNGDNKRRKLNGSGSSDKDGKSKAVPAGVGCIVDVFHDHGVDLDASAKTSGRSVTRGRIARCSPIEGSTAYSIDVSPLLPNLPYLRNIIVSNTGGSSGDDVSLVYFDSEKKNCTGPGLVGLRYFEKIEGFGYSEGVVTGLVNSDDDVNLDDVSSGVGTDDEKYEVYWTESRKSSVKSKRSILLWVMKAVRGYMRVHDIVGPVEDASADIMTQGGPSWEQSDGMENENTPDGLTMIDEESEGEVDGDRKRTRTPTGGALTGDDDNDDDDYYKRVVSIALPSPLKAIRPSTIQRQNIIGGKLFQPGSDLRNLRNELVRRAREDARLLLDQQGEHCEDTDEISEGSDTGDEGIDNIDGNKNSVDDKKSKAIPKRRSVAQEIRFAQPIFALLNSADSCSLGCDILSQQVSVHGNAMPLIAASGGDERGLLSIVEGTEARVIDPSRMEITLNAANMLHSIFPPREFVNGGALGSAGFAVWEDIEHVILGLFEKSWKELIIKLKEGHEVNTDVIRCIGAEQTTNINGLRSICDLLENTISESREDYCRIVELRRQENEGVFVSKLDPLPPTSTIIAHPRDAVKLLAKEAVKLFRTFARDVFVGKEVKINAKKGKMGIGLIDRKSQEAREATMNLLKRVGSLLSEIERTRRVEENKEANDSCFILKEEITKEIKDKRVRDLLLCYLTDEALQTATRKKMGRGTDFNVDIYEQML